jgi:hypothetical protein
MIEVASWPANLAQWDAREQPFYLEVFGETTPLVDTHYAEVQSPGSPDGTAPAAPGAPIYEYWWTIGHPGRSNEMRHWWDVTRRDPSADDLWENLEDMAARVYLYFPLGAGWRIKELVATVKYLSPALKGVTWWSKVAEDWQAVAPVVQGMSSVASLAPIPGAGSAAALLSSIAKMQINSVPQTEGFEWSVGKVTFGSPLGVMQGVMWRLPKRMFVDLGGRLTGSIALSFIPSQVQKPETIGTGAPVFQPQPLLAHAVVLGKSGPIWVPGEREFVRLHLAPSAP